MLSNDLYGLIDKDLEAARRLIEQVLGIRFEGHDSSYLGGVYYRYGAFNAEHFVLHQNLDIVDNEPIEPSYSAYPLLLYVNKTDRSEQIAALVTEMVEGAALLKHGCL